MRSVRAQLLVTLAAVLIAAGFLLHRGAPPNESLWRAVGADSVRQLERHAAWGSDLKARDGAGARVATLRGVLFTDRHRGVPDGPRHFREICYLSFLRQRGQLVRDGPNSWMPVPCTHSAHTKCPFSQVLPPRTSFFLPQESQIRCAMA